MPQTEAIDPIALEPIDRGLLDAPPLLVLVRLVGAVAEAAVREAVAAHLPRRFAASAHGATLRANEHARAVATLDAPAGTLDALTATDVPIARLAAIGLDAAPLREPLCTVAHVRSPDGDALALRVSHAAGDGISVVRLLDAILDDLELSAPPRTTVAGAPRTTAGDDPRHWSVLALSRAARAEITAVTETRGATISPTVCRMAVVARRVAAIALDPDQPLRVRVPIDLRFRGLGIAPDAVGNFWFDALAAVDGRPPASELAVAIDAAIRTRLAEITPDDVDYRPGASLRLRRALPGAALQRGVDLVHSSLPLRRRDGVRATHVLGSASLGVVDVRGADHVDLVTPHPTGAAEL